MCRVEPFATSFVSEIRNCVCNVPKKRRSRFARNYIITVTDA